jgi:hypothetical protein
VNWEVRRRWYTPRSTISELLIPSHLCYMLEDRIRPPGVKVKGVTAIPPGRYQVVVTFSDRFQRPLPQLLDVPLFSGIRWHSGNKAVDTEGCQLPGLTRATDWVGRSRDAFDQLWDETEKALKDGKLWVNVIDDPAPECRDVFTKLKAGTL